MTEKSNISSVQNRIMVAVDSSEDSVKAMEYTLKHVCRPGDNVTIVHGHAVAPLMYPGAGTADPTDADFMVPPDLWHKIREEAREESLQILKSFEEMAQQAEVAYQSVSLEGDPRDLIVKEANKRNIDILVLGSRGLGAIKRALLGSVSDFCVHHANCPVLIVRKNPDTKKALEEGNDRTFLFAVDESQKSKDAFRWALKHFFRPEKDHIVLMTAMTIPSWAAYTEFTTTEMEDKIESEELQDKRELLQEFHREARAAGLKSTMDVVRGDAREAILWAAKRHQTNALIVGNRGLGAMSRLFLGSVSSYLCHNANCPVLVIKVPNHSEQSAPPNVEEKEA